MPAAPHLLAHGPLRHPVGIIARRAVQGQRRRGASATRRRGAALARVLAAPHLLAHGPLRHARRAVEGQRRRDASATCRRGQPLPVFWQHHVFLPTDQSWHSPPCSRRATAAAPARGVCSLAPAGRSPCLCAGSTRPYLSLSLSPSPSPSLSLSLSLSLSHVRGRNTAVVVHTGLTRPQACTQARLRDPWFKITLCVPLA